MTASTPRRRPGLSAHQRETVRLYEELGTYSAVANHRGVTVESVAHTLTLVRHKLGVPTTADAIVRLRHAEAGR